MDKLSLFADFFSKQPSVSTLLDVVNTIKRNEKLKSITEAYRSTHDHRIKETSYTFAVAVRFEGGKGKGHVTGYTGMSLVDLDHVPLDKIAEAKHLICQDPHTLICYTTISGEGLRIIFRYELDANASQEQQAKFYIYPFLAGNRYYELLTGCSGDPLCKNATRLSGMAYDPEAYFNPDAIAFTHEEVMKHANKVYKQNKEEKAKQRIEQYYQGFISPLLARQDIVYQPGKHNDYVMRVGYMLAEKGYNRKASVGWAKEKFKEYENTEAVVNSCFDNAGNQHKTVAAHGNQVATVQEIEDYLSAHVQLRYNEVLSRVEQFTPEGWTPMQNGDYNELWRNLSKVERVNAKDMERILNSGFVKHFNPFKGYLEDARKATEGDDTDYIYLLAQTVRVKGDEREQRIWYVYLTKWLVAMVAGWMLDGEVNNVILVFIGKQGTYKSTWQRMLLPPELSQYFSLMANVGRMSKDDKIKLASKGLVCCEELDTMSNAELNQFKSIVTMTYIDERAPYAHFSERKKRYASFCGNGNNPMFLSDSTGNRRWLPFEIVSIQSPREHPFPYQGIYAQAYRLYLSGYHYWFSDGEVEVLNKRNVNFEAPHVERELVSTYFRKPSTNEIGEFITASRALQIIGGNITQKLSLTKISQAFIELGFERKRVKGLRGFIAIERTADEIRDYLKRISLSDDEPEQQDDDLPF